MAGLNFSSNALLERNMAMIVVEQEEASEEEEEEESRSKGKSSTITFGNTEEKSEGGCMHVRREEVGNHAT